MRKAALGTAFSVSLAALLSGCGQNTSSLPGVPSGLTPKSAGSQSKSLPASPPMAIAACPANAVFVRLDVEIRGYPLDAQGATAPCARVSGPDAQLTERGPLAISKNGNLHTMSFQSNGPNGLIILAPDATGDATPVRMATTDQDHVALAIDSHINDYIIASENYSAQNCWSVVGDGLTSSVSGGCDSNLQGISALATNAGDELIVAGTEVTTGRGRIDVYDRPASAAPQLVRSIVGPATGLASISQAQASNATLAFSLATKPATGEIYAYESVNAAGADPPKILEFAANATGDVAPLRTLGGPLVNLVNTLTDSLIAVNVLAVDAGGNVYSLSQGATLLVSVFGPQARDNALPDHTFSDTTAVTSITGLGFAYGVASLAVRSTVPEVTTARRSLRVLRR